MNKHIETSFIAACELLSHLTSAADEADNRGTYNTLKLLIEEMLDVKEAIKELIDYHD